MVSSRQLLITNKEKWKCVELRVKSEEVSKLLL